MDDYKLALDDFEGANNLFESGKYRLSIYLYCLAIEQFLKSKIDYVDHPDVLEIKHDVINLLKYLEKKYPFKGDRKFMNTVRKYFNESRYPYSPEDLDQIFTKDFAQEFKDYTLVIKDYIDNDVVDSLETFMKSISSSNNKSVSNSVQNLFDQDAANKSLEESKNKK